MSINFRYDGYTYPLWGSGSRVTTPSLCYRKDGTTYYIPLLTSRSQTIGDYVYYASGPYMKNPLCVKKDGITYYATFFRNLIYAIPAGTYTPSVFENLIKQYISINGSRYCLNAFTATVNGHTYNVPRGQPIKYRTTNTAGSGTNSTLRIVTFNDRTYAQAQDANSLYFDGTYVVYASNFSGHATFSNYANYSITIETGIRFN